MEGEKAAGAVDEQLHFQSSQLTLKCSLALCKGGKVKMKAGLKKKHTQKEKEHNVRERDEEEADG